MSLNPDFCTLFDSNYLSRGLALYESLIFHVPNARLFVVAFDELAYETIRKLNYKNLIPVSLEEFEDEELLNIKPTRSKVEYCWTCTPSIILYCINRFKLSGCTYVDADVFFYSSPQPLLDELGSEYSVSITEHNYSKEYDQTETSGIYCVQFMTFKNDSIGVQVLKWWRDKCIEWCFNRIEDGKFGDQKYLDDWTSRFKGVKVLSNLGCGIAPWNIQQYDFSNQNQKIIFYHFHGLKFYQKVVQLIDYKISKGNLDAIYPKYLNALKEANLSLKDLDSDFNGTKKLSVLELTTLYLKSILRGRPKLAKRTF